MSKPCGVPTPGRYCEEPKDKEMGDGFCTDHSDEWRCSEEFQQANRDDKVIFAAQLRISSMLNRALAPFKRRWKKRLEKEQNSGGSDEGGSDE